MHSLARIFSIATYLLLGGGLLFYILGPRLNDSWKEMMLSQLSVLCIFMGIITALAGALCDLILKRHARTQPGDEKPGP